MRPDLDDAALRRYLLGLLPEAEAESLEEAYLSRPDVLERVRGVEDDLLDDYASGRLEPGEKGAFESRYLASAPLRERVVAARALRLATGDTRRPAVQAVMRRVRWVPVAIAAGVLLGVLAFSIRSPRPSEVTSASLPADPAGPSATSSPESAAPTGSSSVPTPGTLPRGRATSRLVLALSPVLLRGQARPARLRIPADADVVVLELEGDPALLAPSTSALQVVVRNVDGEEAWRGEARRVRNAARPSLLADARVPATKLAAADYLVTLSSSGTAGGTLHSYFFRVTP